MRHKRFIAVLIGLLALVTAPSRAAVCEPSNDTRQSLKRLDVRCALTLPKTSSRKRNAILDGAARAAP